MKVFVGFEDASVGLECRSLMGHERLGEAHHFALEMFSPESVERDKVVGRGCTIRMVGAHSSRDVAGIVTSFAAVATSNPGSGRRYRLVVQSKYARLTLRTRSKIFQHLSVPDILKHVLAAAGFGARDITVVTKERHAPREYVVQYAETDAAFVRRLCEDEGLYFRFECGERDEQVVVEDTSSAAPEVLDAPLPVVDRRDGLAERATAFLPEFVFRRRPGKVTLRDYDQEKPALALEGVSTAGTPVELEVEVYAAPGGFKDQNTGAVRASRRLESLRADGKTLFFETTALSLAPGGQVTLESGPDLLGMARPEGDYFIVALEHRWREGEPHAFRVEAIPAAVPFRLPRTTPQPKIHGVHQAFVTGAAGSEVHVDEQGRVRVHFLWDRGGHPDHKSSLPIRVMQPNTAGSMLLPRVGWEVLVAFEDGDPDRPYVLGRVYNNKTPPPLSLPANKTATMIGTSSSPGAGRRNSLRFDDAAGRQVLAIDAGFAKATTVASNMVTQTVKNEALTVKGSQSRSVGATETVSVRQAYLTSVGSQSGMIGGTQKIYVKGDASVGVGSETVVVGGACIEKVGNPVSGALNLAKAAAMSGAGALGTAGTVATTAAGLGEAGYAGSKSGGLAGMAGGVGMGAFGMVANAVPGGGAVLGAITEAVPMPWQNKPLAPGSAAPGGGASAASDASGPSGPGPGHRDTIVQGAMTELVGGALGIVSPGTVGWTTIGASSLLIGGSRTTRAGQAGTSVAGASTETVGNLTIKSGSNITRDVTGALSTTIAGGLTSKAGGEHAIKAGASLKISVGGALTMSGSHVTFTCGDSTLTASSSGIMLKASTITVTGLTTQSKETGHK